MSPKRSFGAPHPRTVARHCRHHERRLTNVPILAGITRAKWQQPHCRTCVVKPLPPLIQSGLQDRWSQRSLWRSWLKRPSKLSAQMEERRSPKRSQNMRTVIRTWHHVEAACQVDGELGLGTSCVARVLHDVSIPAGTPCLRDLATRKLYQQTLEHFLTFVAKRCAHF